MLSYHVPETFERRGAYAWLTAELLKFARLRIDSWDDPNRQYLLLPNYVTDRKNSFSLVPLGQVEKLTELNTRDSYFLEDLRSLVDRRSGQSIDPIDLHDLARKNDINFGEDPAAQAAAKQEISQQREAEQQLRENLISQMACEFGAATGDPVLKNLNLDIYQKLQLTALHDDKARDTLDMFRDRALANVAKAIGQKKSDLTWRIHRIANLLAPLQTVPVLNSDPVHGFLIQHRNRLRAFQQDIEDLRPDVSTQMQKLVDFVEFCADGFLAQAARSFDLVDRRIFRLIKALSRFEQTESVVIEERRRVAWLMDGWEPVIKLWEHARDTFEPDSPDMERAFMQVFLFIPTLPKSEIDRMQDDLNKWNNLETIRGRLVKEGHDWRTGEADRELLERLIQSRQK